MRDRIVLLGTKGGPAIRPGSAMPTSTLLQLQQRSIVVDCGLGVTRGLVDAGISLTSLDLVFVTHLHSDHYLELGPLIHTAWTAGLDRTIDVFGPAGLRSYWRHFLAAMDADIALRIADEGRPDLESLVRLHEVAPGRVLESNGIAVDAMRNQHPPLIDSFALRFAAGGKTIVFSGDTAFMPALADFARHADLLVHEAMLEEALPALVARVGNTDERLMAHLRRSHTTAGDAARIAATAKVARLVLNHRIPSDDPQFGDADWARAINPHWQGEYVLGTDGMTIEF